MPIINRLIEPTSKAGINDWYRKTCLPLIQHKKLSLSSQNYWYYLDQLNNEKMTAIWEEMLLNLKSKLKIDDATFLYDLTNVFTYIDDHEGNTLPQKGHSKQMRNDKNLLALSLVIGEHSELPYSFSSYPANIHDSKRFPDFILDVRKKVQLYDKEKITLVFDKGNNSEDNFKVIKGHYFVGALTKNKEEAQDLIDAKFKFCYTNNNENDIYSVSKEAEVYGMRCKIVVSFNKELEKKQLHSLEKKIAKTQLKFQKIDHLFKSQKTAINAMNLILPKKQNVFEYEIKKEGNKFRVELKLSTEKLTEYRKGFGKNIIFTNHSDWSDERIIRAYRSMHKIENQFRILHGILLIPIKPVYHWTDQKIEVHIFLCMVSLLFAKTLEYICRDKVKGDFRHILDFAASIRIALVQREQPKLVFEEISPEQQKLMEAFSLSRFAKK